MMRAWLMIAVGLMAAAGWQQLVKKNHQPSPPPKPGEGESKRLESTFKGGGFAAEGRSPVPNPADVPRYFAKVPEGAMREITRRVDAGVRVTRQAGNATREVPYTATTGWLLTAIISRMDRKRNRAEISYPELMRLAGIKSRTTLTDHLFLLEEHLGYIRVRRGSRGKKRAVNVFSLQGEVARVVLNAASTVPGESPERTRVVRSADGNPESRDSYDGAAVFENKPHPGEGVDKEPIPESCKSIDMDEAVARDLIRDYGRERVTEIATWAAGQRWAENRAGLAVARIRDTSFSVPLPPVPRTPLPAVSVAVDPDDEWETEEAPQPPVDPVWVADVQTGAYNALDAWRVAMDQMRMQFDRITFGWVAGAQLRDCDGITFVIEAKNPHALTQLRRLHRDVRSVLRTVTGIEADVRFECEAGDELPAFMRT